METFKPRLGIAPVLVPGKEFEGPLEGPGPEPGDGEANSPPLMDLSR